MKSIRFLTALFLLSIGIFSFNQLKAQSAQINISIFQNELTPYGRWLNNPRYGQVWIYNDPAFRPYATDGHWEYTNYGWSWVSDFDWGWAPFHYGRWEHDRYDGWMWIPGYDWASAWVSWSQYDGYYGWAPLGYGAGINISFDAVPYDRWNFMPRQYMGSSNFYGYCAPPRNNYFRNAVTINNFYEGREGRFTKGPERREVERFTNNRIEERHIDYRGRNGNNNNGNKRDNSFAANMNRNNTISNNQTEIYNDNNNRNRNNNEQRNVYENRNHTNQTNRNIAPQNNPVNNNNRSDNNNNADRPPHNFPGMRPNQTENNTIPPQMNNRFERPQEQKISKAPTASQEARRPERNEQYQQRSMEQRNAPQPEIRRLERQPAVNNDRQMQQRNEPKSNRKDQPNLEGGKRQGRD